jgi:phosphate:Na+ symporter
VEVFNITGKILTLIGSLGLFLFGMKLLSEALQKVAGNRMRQVLAAMTNNRIKGVFTGMLVTTTIQSSSATTVMVVSFVNAGLLSLIAAVGVIMGANIGTTVTAWIISILGFKISLSFLSLPLIGISFPFFFSKNSIRKSWGEFIIGFAILFIGLQFLKESVPDVKSNPEVLNFLASYTDLGFASVLIFVLIGTVMTTIIQSSSATMALTLVMCYNGLISFELAAAMVLGENIGTTITANIAAVVANVSAKRAARAHLIFNIFGVIWILAVFHPFLRGIDFMVSQNHGTSILSTNLSQVDFEETKNVYPVALAIFHTTFNVINTGLLIGLANFIAKVATMMVPSRDDEDEEFRLKYIKSGMFSTSELSIIQAKKEIVVFGNKIEKMFSLVTGLKYEDSTKKYEKLLKKIARYEQITDNMEVEIANYLTSITEGEISRDGSMKIRAMLHIIDDLESIADTIYQLSLVIDNKNKARIKFNTHQEKSLNQINDLVKESILVMANNLRSDYKDVDIGQAILIEENINKKRNELRERHVDDLKEKKYKHKTGAFYSDIFSLNEKIGDYVVNISEAIDESNAIKKHENIAIRVLSN